MGFLDQLQALVDDPPPPFAFELSETGIATGIRPARRGQSPELRFAPFPTPVLAITPVADNVSEAEELAAHVASLASPNGNRRKAGRPTGAAIILPDYCARIAVLSFDAFPAKREEQASLVRFRMKKTVPFDVDSAAVSFHVQKSPNKKTEVVVAAASREIVARYEAPFRAAGYFPGHATTSAMAALDLMPTEGLSVMAKLSGRVLTVAVCDGRAPKMVRCLELEQVDASEVLTVLFPTFAYAEDELKRRPDRICYCGFPPELAESCGAELSAPVEPLRSLWGPAQHHNAGLLGWLQAQEGK